MGKTSLAIDLIRGTPEDRVFIFDPDDEFSTRMGIKRTAVTWEEFYEFAETDRIVCFDPSHSYGGYAVEGFEDFCDVVFKIARDGLSPKNLDSVVVTDEVQKYVNAQYAPPSFKNILETGRKSGLSSISLSRAPNRVNVSIREEFTELCLFRLDDENSLKFVAGLGVDTDIVRTLPEHHYLYVNVLKGTSRVCSLPFAKNSPVTLPEKTP